MSDFLTRLEELDKAATPGPWRVYHNGQIVVDGEDADGPTVTLVLDRKDTELLVHLRNHVPEILALVKAAREVVEGWAPEAYDEMPELQRCRAALEALDK